MGEKFEIFTISGTYLSIYTWFLSNAQSLVLMAIVVIIIYLGFKREFSKLIGFLVVALVAVFNIGGVKDVLLRLSVHKDNVLLISIHCSIINIERGNLFL